MVVSSITTKLQRRLLFAFFGSAALVLTIAILPSSRLKAEKESSARLTQLRENIDVTTSVLNALVNAETGVRGYLLTREKSYLEPYELGRKQLDEALPKLVAIPGHQKEIETLKRLVAEQIRLSEDLIARPGKPRIDWQKRLMDAKRQVLARLQAEEESERLALLRQRRAAWAGDLAITMLVSISVASLLYWIQKWLRDLVKAQESLTLALAAEHEARISQERLATSARDLVNLVGHEVGAPLLQIRVALDTARSRVTDDNFKKFYNLGMVGITRIQAITKEVLELQRVTELSLPIKLETIELREWCFTLAWELDIYRIKVLVQDGSFTTDKVLLRRALLNILDNALKYSSEEIVIFRCIQQDESLLFIIRDKGVGIPHEYLKDLWQPFARGRNVLSIPGRGLGLVTARKSVERLGGIITIASQEGVGTEAVVKLPAS
jgi:signal transduction histidine kinase